MSKAAKYFVYILQSKNGKFYAGYTTDLERRMEEHRSGRGSKFVRAFGFDKLLYHETFRTRSKAMKREAEIKSWPRAKKAALIHDSRRVRSSKVLVAKAKPRT